MLGANQTARQMVPLLQPDAHRSATPLHCSALFAMVFEMLFDAANQSTRRYGTGAALNIPLPSGICLHALLQQADQIHQPTGAVRRAAEASRSLRKAETALIRQAMEEPRGSVLKAAHAGRQPRHGLPPHRQPARLRHHALKRATSAPLRRHLTTDL